MSTTGAPLNVEYFPEGDIKVCSNLGKWRAREICGILIVYNLIIFLLKQWLYGFNPLNPELNPICYLLALLEAHHFLRVSRIRVKLLTLRW